MYKRSDLKLRARMEKMMEAHITNYVRYQDNKSAARALIDAGWVPEVLEEMEDESAPAFVAPSVINEIPQIEANVPIMEDGRRRSGQPKGPFRVWLEGQVPGMKVGDSFVIEQKQLATVSVVFRMLEREHISRRLSDGRVRVWVTK